MSVVDQGEGNDPPDELTVRLMVVVCVRLPDMPVMVTLVVPVAAVPLAVNVNVLVPVVFVGLNDAVTPPGNPEADRFTLPLKPLRSLTVIVFVPLAPCTMERLFVEDNRLKSGAATTPLAVPNRLISE